MSIGQKINEGSVQKVFHLTALDGTSMVKEVTIEEGKVRVVIEGDLPSMVVWSVLNARIGWHEFLSPRNVIPLEE